MRDFWWFLTEKCGSFGIILCSCVTSESGMEWVNRDTVAYNSLVNSNGWSQITNKIAIVQVTAFYKLFIHYWTLSYHKQSNSCLIPSQRKQNRGPLSDINE